MVLWGLRAIKARERSPPQRTRRRAAAPKVKTGCTTCKTRHLKCDEGKPICQRCLKDRYKCDGYDEGNQSKLQKPLHIVPFVAYKTKHITSSPPTPATPRPAITTDIPIDAVDAALYHYARDRITRDFEMTDTNGFWQNVVLPLSHMNKPIKYALCAFGGAHRMFVARNCADFAGSTPFDPDAKVQAIQKYNEAIMHIQPVMAITSMSNIQTTLICCMIFTCIENMHGRYADSIRHIRAGCQLLNTYLWESEQTQAAQGFLSSNDPFDPQAFINLRDLFYWLGQNVSLYHGDLVFRDLDSHPRLRSIGDPQTPFASLSEAEQGLAYIDHTYDLIFKAQDSRGYNSTEAGPFYASNAAQCHLRALAPTRSIFTIWSARFDLLKSLYNGARLSKQQERHIALLSLHQATWSAFIRRDHMEDDYHPDDCKAILSKIETLLDMDTNGNGPLFSFDGDLVSSIAIVCASCKEDDVLDQAIGLLQSMRRTEGIWDSKDIVALVETTRRAIEDGLLTWQHMPRSVPQLAAEMARLRPEILPCQQLEI